MKKINVHWVFKEEPTRIGLSLCDAPSAARAASHSIILRPVIHQKRGGRFRECARCSKIGKELNIP